MFSIHTSRQTLAAMLLRTIVMVAVLHGYSATAISGTKVLVFGRPALNVAQPTPTNATDVTFVDLWTLDPSEYEVLGHVWIKGKSDFSKSGPGEQAAREEVGAQVALLGGDLALGFHTGNFTVFEGKLWYPGGGIGIDTRWSSALAARKRSAEQEVGGLHPPISVALLPLMVTDDVSARASNADLYSISTYSFAATWCLLGQRGYHVEVLPDTLFNTTDAFNPDSASLQALAKSICPWSDYIMILALGNPSGETSKGTMKKVDTLSALFNVREGRWASNRSDAADLVIREALNGLGGDLRFIKVTTEEKLEDMWNKSVVGTVKGNVKILPALVAQ